MDIERRIEIAAPRTAVWATLTDVERWPAWTASVTRVEHLDEPPLRRGSRVRIRQPRLGVLTWTVTACEPGASFTWQASRLGVRTVAGHRVAAADEATARVTLSVTWSGPLAPVTRWLFGTLSRRFVELEAQGLKQRCEAAAAGPRP